MEIDSPPQDPLLDESAFRRVQTVFWVLYLILPIFTGWLAYKWLPDEAFDEKDHLAISTYEIESRDGGTTEVVAVWQNKKSGKTFSTNPFPEHRESEAKRLAMVWLGYGLIGCLFFAWSGVVQRRHHFYDSFGKAVLVNLVVAGYTWYSTAK